MSLLISGGIVIGSIFLVLALVRLFAIFSEKVDRTIDEIKLDARFFKKLFFAVLFFLMIYGIALLIKYVPLV